MPEVVVPVTWVDQEQLYYCGPAVAQMTLAALQTNAPIAPPSWQDQLWADIKAHTTGTGPGSCPPDTASGPPFANQKCETCSDDSDCHCWSTTPPALKRVLNLRQTTATFAVNPQPDEASATAALMTSIDHQIPGIALVYGWTHWIVVDGYVVDEADSCMVANGHAVHAVYIRNSNEQSVHLVKCDRWREHYLSFVPCGDFMDTIVVITGALKIKRPRKAAKQPRPQDPPPYEPGGNVPRIALPAMRAAMIVPPSDASREAERARGELLQSPRWQVALSASTPQPPLLVQQLDRDDSYYYIVPYVRGSVVTARVLVNAMSDRFGEAAGIEHDGDSLPPFVDPSRELARWHGETIDLPSLRSRVIRPGTVGAHPVLVWRPCRESTSPFMPFYLMTIGNEVIYLRVDGRRFTRLTTAPA